MDTDLKSISERHRVVDLVGKAILSMIAKQDLRPGDELPSQGALVQQLGVGRNSLREAIQRLVALGAIEVGSGRKMTVGKAIQNGMMVGVSVEALDASLQRRTVEELSEVRAVLEAGFAVLTAERAAEPELDKLGRIVEAMRNAKDRETLARLNTDFHTALAQGSGNETAWRLVRSLTNRFYEALENLTDRIPGQETPAARFEDHDQIYRAVRRRDVDEIRRLMRQHVKLSSPS
jgi:GntR family transcriptional repressor for pyruvate dehydrogenase complex